MSRCFPYPPPGYVRNGALIESIEWEREKANTKQRKEKKREKKEKRKEEEEKIHYISDDKSHKGEKRKYDLIGAYLSKEREDETEHLERSGLTEEHEQPIFSQNSCYLSDGSQSSRKREWHTSPSNHGNISRIRLSLRKHREPDVSFSSEEQLCSTCGRKEPLAQQKEVVQCCSIKTDTVELTPEPNKEIAYWTKLYENQMKSAESECKALIEDWVAPPLQFEQNESDDLKWLFGTKQQKKQERKHGCKRLKADNDASCHASATLWPRAQYLPEVDIYALPYTILF